MSPVPLPVTSPSTEARAALKAIIDAEFAVEGFTVLNDRLHESLGNNGTRLGISPNRERLLSGNDTVLTVEIFFQFYGKWNEEIDPTTKVDPAKFENYAERFRRAIEAASHVGDSHLWYFRLLEVNYPPDPTGNKSRFEATLLGYGNNAALVESTG